MVDLDDGVLDVVIVGAGVAGLSAAWALRDRNIVVLESEDRVGGRLCSHTRGNYWINYGAHLVGASGTYLADVRKDVGLSHLSIRGGMASLYFQGRVYPANRVEAHPLRLPLSLRERLALIRSGLKLKWSVRGYHRAARPVPGETLLDRQERLGNYLVARSASEYIGQLPARVESIIATASRRASSDMHEHSAGVEASLYAAVWGGGRGESTINVSGGSARLPEEMARVLGNRVAINSTVTKVLARGDLQTVDFDRNGESHRIRAKMVIVAAPAPVAETIVEGLDAGVRSALQAVRYGPFVTLGILTNEAVPMPWDNVYAMTTPGLSFNMFFNHANPLRSGVRVPGGSLMVYAGGSDAERLLPLSDDEITKSFLQDLEKIYPETKGIIEEAHVKRWEFGNSYRGPGADFGGMLDYCRRTGQSVHFAGDYFSELGGVDRAAASGVDAARRVRQELVRQFAETGA